MFFASLVKKLKYDLEPVGTTQSIWDHTVLPASQHSQYGITQCYLPHNTVNMGSHSVTCLITPGRQSCTQYWVDQAGYWLYTEMVYLSKAFTHPGTNQGSKNLGFFKKPNPVGFIGFWGFICFFGQAGKNR